MCTTSESHCCYYYLFLFLSFFFSAACRIVMSFSQRRFQRQFSYLSCHSSASSHLCPASLNYFSNEIFGTHNFATTLFIIIVSFFVLCLLSQLYYFATALFLLLIFRLISSQFAYFVYELLPSLLAYCQIGFSFFFFFFL